jgi:hypothetical protein
MHITTDLFHLDSYISILIFVQLYRFLKLSRAKSLFCKYSIVQRTQVYIPSMSEFFSSKNGLDKQCQLRGALAKSKILPKSNLYGAF